MSFDRMNYTLGAVTYLVRDYEEAKRWFADKLGFILQEDTDLGGGKRWLRMAAPGGSSLLLAKAANDEQRAAIGKAAGGRVAFFLYTDDFDGSAATMKRNGVKFSEAPRHESFGTVAVFEDLYGNKWDLIELTSPLKKNVGA
jgi:catechol 2,3-dioxygenase-like lactoylglutathione lyase family enzyme